MRAVLPLAIALTCGVHLTAAETTPEAERERMVSYFAERFPGVPLDAYVYGAMIASPDARKQFDQIMEFPPFIGDIEKGRKLWERPFQNGRSFADCFPNGGRHALGNYPYYDEARDRVVTFEADLNRCLRDNREPEFDYADRNTMGVLTAYARTLSDGVRMSVRIDSPGARAKYEEGKRLFFRRIGQLNAACAGCHLYNAGNIMRMEIISPALGHATHWPIFRGGEELMTL